MCVCVSCCVLFNPYGSTVSSFFRIVSSLKQFYRWASFTGLYPKSTGLTWDMFFVKWPHFHTQTHISSLLVAYLIFSDILFRRWFLYNCFAFPPMVEFINDPSLSQSLSISIIPYISDWYYIYIMIPYQLLIS